MSQAKKRYPRRLMARLRRPEPEKTSKNTRAFSRPGTAGQRASLRAPRGARCGTAGRAFGAVLGSGRTAR
eukprot:8495061-Pyramimonas_sp.AAC.1